jgi:uncharacterized protein YdeI (YjbR/CyaY-like superfamily)
MNTGLIVEHKGLPVQTFENRREWERWLAKKGTSSGGLWVKLAKKDSGLVSISKADAVEVAIAHGWIDGQLDRHDAKYWLVRFTPRGPKSKWSQTNRDTADRLIVAKRMTRRGLAEVENAKADGRWATAYASQSKATIPDDLRKALQKNKSANAFFSTVSAANRYAVLYRVHDAKTPVTRAARIEKFVAMLARGETLHE